MSTLAAPAAESTRSQRRAALMRILKAVETLREDIDTFSDITDEDDPLLSEAGDDQIFDELSIRSVNFYAWDNDGDEIAGTAPALSLILSDSGSEDPDLFEAIARHRRGDLLEALIHLERAIPALSGLHDAVRNLQR